MGRSAWGATFGLLLAGSAAALVASKAPPPNSGGAVTAHTLVGLGQPAAADSALLRAAGRADSLVEDAVRGEQIPGAVLLIAHGGKVLLEKA